MTFQKQNLKLDDLYKSLFKYSIKNPQHQAARDAKRLKKVFLHRIVDNSPLIMEVERYKSFLGDKPARYLRYQAISTNCCVTRFFKDCCREEIRSRHLEKNVFKNLDMKVYDC